MFKYMYILRPGDVYVRQSSWVLLMVSCLFGTKLPFDPMMTHCYCKVSPFIFREDNFIKSPTHTNEQIIILYVPKRSDLNEWINWWMNRWINKQHHIYIYICVRPKFIKLSHMIPSQIYTPLWKSNRNFISTQIFYHLFFVVCSSFYT